MIVGLGVQVGIGVVVGLGVSVGVGVKTGVVVRVAVRSVVGVGSAVVAGVTLRAIGERWVGVTAITSGEDEFGLPHPTSTPTTMMAPMKCRRRRANSNIKSFLHLDSPISEKRLLPGRSEGHKPSIESITFCAICQILQPTVPERA